MATVPGAARTMSAGGSTCVTTLADLTVAAGSCSATVSGDVMMQSSPGEGTTTSTTVSLRRVTCGAPSSGRTI
eukprot:2309142-Prymnesium_polylepis.1